MGSCSWGSGIATREKAPDTRYPTPEPYSLLEVTPKTGRTHQIRVHLASIGHPIVGDPLYGPKKKRGHRMPVAAGGKENMSNELFHPLRLMLHALSLEFVNRDGRRMRFEAEPPSDFLGESNT